MKKTKLSYNEYIDDIINKALEPYDVTIDCLRESYPDIQNIDGLAWYQKFTFNSKEEHDKWLDYVVKRMKDCPAFKYSSIRHKKEVAKVLDLQYGLKANYEL